MGVSNRIRGVLRRSLWKIGVRVVRRSALPTGFSLAKDLSDDGVQGTIKCIFDVGANVGQMALHLSEQFPQASIFSFEPVGDTFKDLQSNIKSVPNIHPVNIAMGAQESKETIFLQENSVFNSLTTGVNAAGARMRKEEVNVSTVDRFCDNNNITEIDILKIDTEGYDLNVLRGSAGMLRNRKIRYVLTEVGFSQENFRNVHFNTMHAFMTSNGFLLRGIYNQTTNERGYIVYADALYRLMPDNDR